MSKRQFEKFYNKHLDKIFRFVFFRVGANRDLAEDLVSEIFLKALKNFDSYDEEKSKSAWIMTIARNHLANYWRDKKESVVLPENDGREFEDGEMSIRSSETLPIQVNISQDSLKQREISLELEKMLSFISETDREIVTLHYLSGYSYAEISQIMEMSETAVKVASHRAIKKMRENNQKIYEF